MKRKYRVYAELGTTPEALKQGIERVLCPDMTDITREVQSMLKGQAGAYRTVQITVTVENQEMSNLHAFLNGPVLLYYYRQMRDMWETKPTASELKECKDELKERIRFYNWDHEGKIAGLGSFKQFTVAKRYAEKIEQIREVVFEDNGLLFPDSDQFKDRKKRLGIKSALKLAENELIVWQKNKQKQE